MTKYFVFVILLLSSYNSWASSLQCVEVFKVAEVKTEDLIHAAFMLLTTANTNLLHPELLKSLNHFANKQGLRGSLENPQTARKILVALFEMLPHREVMDQSLGAYLSQIKKLIANESPDFEDFRNGWGFELLSNKDPIYQDPQYLMNLMSVSHQSALQGYSRGSSKQHEALYEFEARWRKMTNTPAPRFFAVTGSDVISYLVSNYGGPDHVLAFKGSWMASRGIGQYVSSDMVPPVVTEPPHRLRLNEAETRKIEEQEEEVFKILKQRVHTNHNLAAIFIEPIIGSGKGLEEGGVLFFRREFLLKLQEFAKTYNIQIVSDEILTGGGRTGKFFAYQHYEGFEPNVVAFGKGLQIAGYTSLNGNFIGPIGADRGTTIGSYVEPILKANQLLKKMEEEDLLTHVNEVGDYFLQELKKLDPDARGVGVLLFSQNYGPAMGRFMPRLTITKKEIAKYFSPYKYD